MSYELILDDILNWAAGYDGPKFHCIMCDPPYHLTSITKRFGKPNSKPAKVGVYNRGSKGFMNSVWDSTDENGMGIAFNPDTWAALSQHLHPGGFIMAFASSRGWHRMATALEDSGLIIHPSIFGWVTLSSFPKATRIDNQIQDKELAEIWKGHRYGLQALKNAVEPIIVAQKPYEGRPIDNITETGAGAWNIDGGRIPTDDNYAEQWNKPVTTNISARSQNYGQGAGYNHEVDLADYKPEGGRWPANLLLDEAGAELLDRQSGWLKSGGSAGMRNRPETGAVVFSGLAPKFYEKGEGILPSEGGASRMFFQSNWQYEILEQLENADPLKYEPKVSTAEREAGLDSLPLQTRNRVNSGGLENDPKFAPTQMKNHHPTLKPISLTKYLATLLLPPAAYAPRRILVPFSGSGSEGIGALLAGWEEVTMIEGNEEYYAIAEKRVSWWSQWPGWGQTDVDKILQSLEPKSEEGEQLNFFDA